MFPQQLAITSSPSHIGKGYRPNLTASDVNRGSKTVVLQAEALRPLALEAALREMGIESANIRVIQQPANGALKTCLVWKILHKPMAGGGAFLHERQ